MLPALITSGGRGSAALLPGQDTWPSDGAARLISRDMRVEGRAPSLDESDIAARVAQLRGERAGLPPVLWDTLAPTYAPSTAASREDWKHHEVVPNMQTQTIAQRAGRLGGLASQVARRERKKPPPS
jgi:hypothetical protein